MASIAALVLVFALTAPVAVSQPDHTSEMRLDIKMLLSGVGTLKGSGDAEITVSGYAALALRHAIFNHSDSDGNQYLDTNETRNTLSLMANALVGKAYWGISIDSVSDYSNKSLKWILGHTTGLLDSNWNSDSAISFPIGFEGKGLGRTKMLETGQGAYDAFAGAMSDAVGYAFNGTLIVNHRVSTLVIGSFTNPDLASGKLTGLRTPVGEVFWYSFEGEVGPGQTIGDTVAYENFSLKENQQIAFVVLFVGCFLILRMPGKNFDKYEKLHPKKFRRFARPLMSVTISAIVLVAVLVVLYLLPFVFSWASRNGQFYSAYLYLVIVAAAVGEYFFSKSMYGRAALDIPEESVIEVKQALLRPREGEGEILCKICYMPIEAGLDMYQCTCGMSMHVSCAEKSQTCPSCGELLFPQRTRSIQCKSCGETFLYAGSDDAYSIQCTKCGAFQEEIKPGKNYLVVDHEPRNALMMIRALALSGRPAMAITTSFPGKIRSEYDLGEVSVKWFSDSTTDIDNVNPKDLDGDAMEIISTFLMTTKGAGVLIGGVETLIEMNGYDKVLDFVKRLNDLAAIHGSTIILSLNKEALSEEQVKKITEEFDEIHDYS
ncbi:MAG: DUF835 domain-containing protein [Thermoplasmata archaeon]